MKKVIIPTLRFPPAGGVGLRRIIKIAKYFVELGIEVHFITTVNSKQINNYIKDIDDSKVIIKTLPSLSLNNYLNKYKKHLISKIVSKLIYYSTLPFFFVDYALLWGIVLIPYIIYYIRKNSIDNIYVSGPPFSTLYHMSLVKKFLGDKVNLVCEWRDLWIEDYERYYLPPSCLTKNIQIFMERFVLNNCNIVIAVTDSMKHCFCGKVSEKNKVYVFENGYDPADFSNENHLIKKSTKTINIVYTGNIVDTRAEGLYLFLKLFLLIKKRNISCKFELCGELSYKVRKYLDEYYKNLIDEGSIVVHGVISPNDAINMVKRADYGLVIVQRQHPEALTSKFFEYCASRKKVICIGPQGDLKNKVDYNKVGLYIDLDDENSVEKIVEFLQFKDDVSSECFDKIIQENSFKKIAENIQKIFK